jgi:hypothetical protein
MSSVDRMLHTDQQTCCGKFAVIGCIDLQDRVYAPWCSLAWFRKEADDIHRLVGGGHTVLLQNRLEHTRKSLEDMCGIASPLALTLVKLSPSAQR